MSATQAVSEALGRKLMAERSRGLCEIRADGWATEAHHRKNRSQGGTWDPANLLHACHDCHAWITGHPAGARMKGWAILSGSDPATSPAFLAMHGWSLLWPDGTFSHVGVRL